jgi:selenocysteine lyase/cysteine desulfurase
MRCLGLGATARASFGVYSRASDVDSLIDALLAARRLFALPDA